MLNTITQPLVSQEFIYVSMTPMNFFLDGVKKTTKDQQESPENGQQSFGKKFQQSRKSKHRRASVKLGQFFKSF